MAVLERGGNAFDAAVAAGFALQVVEPHLNGPGGDVPAVFYSEAQDEVRVLCGQGPAPAARDDRRATGRSGSTWSRAPARSPRRAGRVRRLAADAARLRHAGSSPTCWRRAIGYARDGYPVVPGIAAAIEAVEDQLRD